MKAPAKVDTYTACCGAGPYGERTAQVGTPGYEVRAAVELAAYRRQLLRIVTVQFGFKTSTMILTVRRRSHDYGSYIELDAVCGGEDKQGIRVIDWLQAHLPESWDDVAKAEVADGYDRIVTGVQS